MARVRRSIHVRTLMAIGLVAYAGLACAQPVAAPTDLDAALRQPLPESEYVNGERCVSTFVIDDTEVLDARRILFSGRNGRVWLNQLRQACTGLALAHDPVLEFELRGSRICRMDSFHSIDRNGIIRRAEMDALYRGGPCFLGDFEPVTEEQAAVIRESLAHARNTRRRAKSEERSSP